jgi:hypothetical protein
MDKEIFQKNLVKAIEIVVPFSLQYVKNPLPAKCLCLVYPNQSYDENPLHGDEQTFPVDSLPKGQYLGPYSELEVVEYLWRDGKVPEWINLTVFTYDENYSYLELLCCGRFTADQRRLYHVHEGYPPFHVLGPALPSSWVSIEKSGKFDLFWRGEKPVL